MLRLVGSEILLIKEHELELEPASCSLLSHGKSRFLSTDICSIPWSTSRSLLWLHLCCQDRQGYVRTGWRNKEHCQEGYCSSNANQRLSRDLSYSPPRLHLSFLDLRLLPPPPSPSPISICHSQSFLQAHDLSQSYPQVHQYQASLPC